MAKKTKTQQLKTLDLHGKTTDQVYDLVDKFLVQQSKSSAKKVRILPGKGSGKVKAVLLDYLKRAGYPWEYEQQSDGKKNQGSLIVFMD